MHVKSFVMCIVGKIAQDVGMVLKCCGVIPIYLDAINCGKVDFTDSGTLVKLFLLHFSLIRTFFRHTTAGILIKMQGTNNTNEALFILSL